MSRGTTRRRRNSKSARSPVRARVTQAERDIVRRLRAGDEDAFDVVYERWHEPMRRLAASYVRGEAQDVVHDVFLNLWRGRATLRVRQSLGGYLLAAVRNRAIDARARVAREQRFPQWLERRAGRGRSQQYDLFEAISVDERAVIERHSYNDGETGVLREELDRIVAAVVRALPARCRAVYEVARELESEGEVLLYATIGARLGISSATVRLQLIKAWDRFEAPLRAAGWPNVLRRQITGRP
ncbi:MAG TPA: sigma-70 family RNA polymerase sigma factor [Gemmatimonadaceae bacterium]|nr:sigma-70 family RNA polymerase sigma factor [Gemmatimonadaceae bacterium]